MDDDDETSVGNASLRGTVMTPALQVLGPMLNQIEPAKARAIVRTLIRLDLMNRESALTVMPQELFINGMGW